VSQDVQALLNEVCEQVAAKVDRERIQTARRRHANMFEWRDEDYMPILFGTFLPSSLEGVKFNWNEQFYDPAKSLFIQMLTVHRQVSGPSDAVPGVRADTGVINCMTIFGAGYQVPEHTKPVIDRYVPKEQLAEFEVPDDISEMGVMPRVREHMEHHLAVLRKWGLDDVVSVYHCDQQGPFDIAAGCRGHEVFLDFYEDPDFLHALLEKATDVYIKVTKFCKALNGEGDGPGNAVGKWMNRGATRMCGDTDILLSPDLYKTFVQPRSARALATLGGGWLHYCGGVTGYNRPEGLHLHELFAHQPDLKGLNWTTAGDWAAEMRKLKELKLVHIGGFPREAGSTLEEHWRRLLSIYDRRCGLILEGAGLREGEEDGAMDLWHRLQDEMFS